jgi:ribonuclease P protein component
VPDGPSWRAAGARAALVWPPDVDLLEIGDLGVLPAAHRLRRAADFQRAVRSGRRSGSRLLVVHLLLNPDQPPAQESASAASADAVPTPVARVARVGFVVNKAVGTAVVRNTVKRRLRHQVHERLDDLPPAADVVIRARPAAAQATAQELGHDLDRCLAKAEGGEQ